MNKKIILLLTLFLFPLLLITGLSSWIIIGNGDGAVGIKPTTREVCYIGETYFTSIEGALKVAKSGDVVHVILNTDSNNPTTINHDCTIPSGVKLNIAHEEGVAQENGEADVFGSDTNAKKLANSTTHIKNIVKINSNVTLTIESGGALLVGGITSGSGGGAEYAGQTSGNHARLILKENAKINSYGTIRCKGYILEESANNKSQIINNAGSSMYIPFILRDFRGGTTMKAIYSVATSKNCPPFNQFEFRNITCLNTIKYGADLYGYANLAARLLIQTQNNHTTMSFIGTQDSSFIIITSTLGYVDLKYNTSEIMNMDFYGGAQIRALKMEIMGMTIDTSTVYFPLTWRFKLTMNKLPLQEKAVFDSTQQKIKFMTGFSMIVNEGCEFKSTNIITYSCFYDKTSARSDSNIGGTAYSNKAPANFEVYGEYTLSDGSTFAGTIIKGSNAKFSSNIGSANNTTLTSYEALVQSSSGSSITVWNTITENVFIVNEADLKTNTIFTVGVTKWDTDYIVPSFRIPEVTNNADILENKTVLLPKKTVVHPTLVSNVRTANYNNAYYKKDDSKTINNKICYFSIVPSSTEMGSVVTSEVRLTGAVDGDKLAPKSTLQLSAACYNSEGNKSYTTQFTWKSSSTSIATVNTKGKVTGVAPGEVTITVTSSDPTSEAKSASVKLTITDPNVLLDASIGVGADSKQSADGARDVELKLTGSPTTAVQSVSWAITDNPDSIASLSSTTGLTTVVTLVDKDDNKTRNVKVVATVTPKEGSPITREITLTEEADTGCFSSDTLVTMGDGNQKQVKDILPGEKILSFNHLTGQYESTKIAMLVNHGYDYYDVMNLEFSNGSEIKFMAQHGLFDVIDKEYKVMTIANYESFIGRTYLQYDPTTNSNMEVVLDNIYITNEYIEAYSILSSRNINVVAENILTMSTSTPGIFNIFELDDNYLVNQKLMKQDIEKYGLVTYEEYKDYVPYELFYDFNFEYLNISIAKGLITEEEIARQIEWYHQMVENGEIIC